MSQTNKLLEYAWLTEYIDIQKDGKQFKVTFNDGDQWRQEWIDINELSRFSKEISLMVYEYFNQDHHDIKPAGFSNEK